MKGFQNPSVGLGHSPQVSKLAPGKANSGFGRSSDLAQALGSAVESHVADVSRRLPQARIALQLDEPLLRDVLRGSIPTQSGWAAYAAVEPTSVGEL